MPSCVVCGAPISAHAAKYRGAVRCRKCANRAKAGTFTHASAGAAAQRRFALDQRALELACTDVLNLDQDRSGTSVAELAQAYREIAATEAWERDQPPPAPVDRDDPF